MEVDGADLGFLARPLVQANLPYRRVSSSTFERRAGRLTLSFQAPPKVGLPFGRYPRLLLAWVATEAVRTQSPELDLGPSLYSFMQGLGITPSGGAHGPRRRFLDQMKRLFSTTISVTWDGETEFATEGYRISSSAYIWWTPMGEDVARGQLTLSGPFFAALLRSPIPIDLGVLKDVSSSLGLDIYCWLSYRSATLRAPLRLRWSSLHLQFGSQTARTRDFRRSFLRELKRVVLLYPFRVRLETDRLTVWPGTVGG